MTRLHLSIIILNILFCITATAQKMGDFPSEYPKFADTYGFTTYQLCNGEQVIEREIIKMEGREYYCSGNLYAKGPLVISDSSFDAEFTGIEQKSYEYERHGKWKVYFDSTLTLLRAEVSYNRGIEDGSWLIYRQDGSLAKEYQFKNGIKKREVAIDETGNRTTLVSLSDARVFFEHNQDWMLLVMLTFIVGIRTLWNLITFNKINGQQLNTGFSSWTNGRLAPFIF